MRKLQENSVRIFPVVHAHPNFIACPEVFSIGGESSQGIRVGFIESDKVLTIFYLLIYLRLR